jgi:hypothetical protein
MRDPQSLSAANRRAVSRFDEESNVAQLRQRPQSEAGAPDRQAGGHWFEPSTAHLRKPRYSAVFVVLVQVAVGGRGA